VITIEELADDKRRLQPTLATEQETNPSLKKSPRFEGKPTTALSLTTAVPLFAAAIALALLTALAKP